jgi:hypothetical protein
MDLMNLGRIGARRLAARQPRLRSGYGELAVDGERREHGRQNQQEIASGRGACGHPRIPQAANDAVYETMRPSQSEAAQPRWREVAWCRQRSG